VECLGNGERKAVVSKHVALTLQDRKLMAVTRDLLALAGGINSESWETVNSVL
jgi:hypothetical protein